MCYALSNYIESYLHQLYKKIIDIWSIFVQTLTQNNDLEKWTPLKRLSPLLDLRFVIITVSACYGFIKTIVI